MMQLLSSKRLRAFKSASVVKPAQKMPEYMCLHSVEILPGKVWPFTELAGEEAAFVAFVL